MQRLVIDYVLEGENRGYNFVTPTDHLPPNALKTLWRQAMPRGQGWAAPNYSDSRSLKCIPLPNRRIAFSEVSMTDKRDEMGRQGIRRAEITLMNVDDYPDYIRAQWERLPQAVRDQAEAKFGFGLWSRIANQALPRVKGESQIVLAYPYTGAREWQIIEAMVIKLATAQRLRLMKGWGKINPFTTLALDYREESRIVALPLEIAGTLQTDKARSIIVIS